ncbi:acetyltransferase [Naviculisporaceae sp. PSN 640]
MAATTTTTITELDLSACHPNSIVDRINAVPGLKTSTAFFTFLRANLVLPHSAMSSNVSTPYLEPQLSTSQSLPQSLSTSTSISQQAPSKPSSAASPNTLDDDIPPLSLDILTTQPEKVDALRLIADSIAQQRQSASLSLVFHPLLLSVLLAALALVYQYAWVSRKPTPDLGTTLTLASGTIMTYLLAIRYVVSPYITHAESLKYDFLINPDTGEEDLVIGTKWDGKLIGATVLRLEPPAVSSPSSKRKSKSGPSFKGGKGVIRAWTTKLRYRGRGVGGDMLTEAVRITREKCGKDAEIGFAREHANAHMVLPEFFNGRFRKGERRAALALEKVVGQTVTRGKR